MLIPYPKHTCARIHLHVRSELTREKPRAYSKVLKILPAYQNCFLRSEIPQSQHPRDITYYKAVDTQLFRQGKGSPALPTRREAPHRIPAGSAVPRRRRQRPAASSSSSPALAAAQEAAQLIANAANPSHRLTRSGTAGGRRFSPRRGFPWKCMRAVTLSSATVNPFKILS